MNWDAEISTGAVWLVRISLPNILIILQSLRKHISEKSGRYNILELFLSNFCVFANFFRISSINLLICLLVWILFDSVQLNRIIESLHLNFFRILLLDFFNNFKRNL